MALYDIIAEIIGYEASSSSYGYNSTLLSICGLIIVLIIVWFLDCLTRLFLRH